jgi:hypothetical protein
MPLLDLKTDLKSLKYGKDRPGGGDSGQPYQQVDINTVDTGFNRFRMTKFDDGLIRGGIVGATNASIVDTFRIGKFLTDFPQGPLFIVRQVGLQLSNPKLETKAIPNIGGNSFLSNIINQGINLINKNNIGPTRIYNLGINTLAQIPVNAFGIHLNRHGLTPIQDENTKYLAVAQANNKNTSFIGAGLPGTSTNRLVQKAITLLPEKFTPGSRILNGLQSILSLIPGASLFIKPTQQIIDDYVGGPGSVYGVGRTFIRRFDYTSNGINKQQSQNHSSVGGNPGNVNYIGTLGLSQQYFSSYNSSLGIGGLNISSLPGLFGSLFGAAARAISGVNATANLRKYNNLDINNPTNAPTNINTATYSGTGGEIKYISNDNKVLSIPSTSGKVVPVKSASYQTYQNIINSKKLTQNTVYVDGKQANQFGIFGDIDTGTKEKLGKTLLPNATTNPLYTNGRTVIRIAKPWTSVTRELRVGSGLQDEINLTPVFKMNAGTIDDSIFISGVGNKKINDLVKFRIQALNGSNPNSADWMIFRAYLTQLTDNTDASWNSVKYNGRGEDFYIYNGFSRKINIGFKVAALSAEEMKPMYQKLNYLMGNVMPDYNGQGLMRGPLVRMTVGNWIDGQSGILNNISYTIPQDSPWEIAINEPITGEKLLILPHIVEVSMTFTPIGSQTYKENKISEKSYTTSHIAQNANEKNNQYITGSIQPGVPSFTLPTIR